MYLITWEVWLLDITIKWNNDTNKMILPVNPSDLHLQGNMNNTNVFIHNLGQINLLGKRNLYSLSISSFFPSQPYSFSRDSSSSNRSYSYYVKNLKHLFETNTVLHIVVSGTLINFYATIEEFSFGHNDGTKDVDYSLSFKEYRQIKSRNTKAAVSKSVTWRTGYTWQSVTKKVLGSSSSWKKQRTLNKKIIAHAKKKPQKKKGVGSFLGTPLQFEQWALVNYKVVIKK